MDNTNRQRIELWFMRDLNDQQRADLYRVVGLKNLPINNRDQLNAFQTVLDTAQRQEIEKSATQPAASIAAQADDATPMAIATAAREFLDCFHGETIVRPLSYDDARKNLDTALRLYGR